MALLHSAFGPDTDIDPSLPWHKVFNAAVAELSIYKLKYV